MPISLLIDKRISIEKGINLIARDHTIIQDQSYSIQKSKKGII